MIIKKNIYSNLAVLTLIFAIFLAPVIEGFIGSYNLRYIGLLVFILLSLIHIFFHGFRILNGLELSIVISSLLIFLVSILHWENLSTPSSYISIVLVGLLIAINNSEFLEKALIYVLIISVLIAIYEFATKKYLYITTSNINGVEYILDESLFSGGVDIFRSKGLFEGPLTFAQFQVFMALLFFRSRLILWIIMFGALLTASRMAMYVIFSLIILNYFFNIFSDSLLKLRKKYLKGFTLMALSIPLLAPTVIFYFGIDFVNRFYEGLTFSGDSNSLRLYFWVLGVEHLLTYDSLEWVLGQNGSFRIAYDNNAENGWLTLLLDNGILGFLIYFVPCLILIALGLKTKQVIYVLFGFVYLLVNFSMTFYLSASGNILYWYAIFKWIREVRS